MTKLQQSLKAALALDAENAVARIDLILKNGAEFNFDPGSISIGIKNENRRLAPLHNFLIEAVGALEGIYKYSTDQISAERAYMIISKFNLALEEKGHDEKS